MRPMFQMRGSPAHSIKSEAIPNQRAEYKDVTDLTGRTYAFLGKPEVYKGWLLFSKLAYKSMLATEMAFVKICDT
jgi:hypothetical protein